MRLAIFFIALVLTVLGIDARLSLNCDKKNTYMYKYRGTASSFGGNAKNKRENEQNTEILADIAVQCHQAYKVQGGKKTNLMSLSFRNVRMHDKLPSKRAGWVKSRGTHEATPVNLDKFFTKPTFAAVNDDGKVTQVFANKNEQVWVRHMKKGVVDMFNTKLRGGKVRLDQSMMGGHKSRYTRVVDRTSGTHRVTRKWDQDDFTSPLFNPREATVKAEASVVVKNGTVIMANTVRKAILGVNPRKHKIFRLKKSTIGIHEDTHANMKDVSGSQGTFSDTTAAAAMILHKVVPFNRAHHAKLHDFFHGVAVDGDEEQSDQIVSLKKAHKIVYSKRPVLKVREGIHASGLNFEQAMEDHMAAAHAQRLKQEINLVDDLVALFKNPEDGVIRSRLSGYVRAHPISSLAALKKTVELAQQHGKKETIKVLQSLLVSIGTDDAQEALLDTLSDAELTHHFLVASIGIQKPSDKVIHHIRDLQKGHASLSDSEDANESLKNLAYLVTADAASRSDNHALRREIVDEMVDNLNNEEVAQDMLVHLHALGNAKTATPVHYWRRFLSTKGMPEQVHNIILNNLEHRTEHGHDDAEVTRLLHDVVSSKHFHPDVKATAVNVLNKRHRTMGLSSSMYYLASLYKDADEGVQREISDYLHGVGNKRAAYVMSAMTDNIEVADELRDEMRDVIMSDVKFFRRVGNFFRRAARSVARAVSGAARRVAQVARRVGHAVGQAARRVGHAVVRAAVAVGKGVVAAAKWIKEAALKVANAFKRLAQKFGKAQFRGEKSCVPASITAGDQICTYDSEFTQFTQGQGDLSNMKYAKHFEFEKLLGAEVVHLYVGMIGYAGIRFTCDQSEPAAFEFSTFAMAKAYAKIFSKDIKLITAQVSFSKLIDAPARNDAIVKIGGKTLFNRNILPNGVTKFLDYCDSTTKSLIHKSYPELVNVKFAFVIVFVPVEFGFNVQAEFGVDAGMGLCITKQEAYVSIEPYFSVAIAGYGSISIFACKGGLSLRAQLNYRLVPRLGLERCQVCAELRHKVKPITFFVDVFVMVLKKKFHKDLFNFGSKEVDASLFKYCIGPRA